MRYNCTYKLLSHLQLASANYIENACYRLNKGFQRNKFVIRSVADVLRTQSRFVKCVWCSASSLTPPTNFTNLLWARSTSVTDLITNNILVTQSLKYEMLIFTSLSSDKAVLVCIPQAEKILISLTLVIYHKSGYFCGRLIFSDSAGQLDSQKYFSLKINLLMT